MWMIFWKAAKHNITLNKEMTTGIQEQQIIADNRRLKQIMYNLLSNAARFTLDAVPSPPKEIS